MVRPYIALTQLGNSLTERVLQKEQAAHSYDYAIALANQALALRKQTKSLELLQQEHDLWQEAIYTLESVHSDSAE